jgi:hypothetical protein
MKWYHYVGIFFAGVFLANAVPHFFHGISGDPFPTPFSDPPGKGLSSPTINVLWGVFNLAVGFILIRISNLSAWHTTGMIVFFLGVLAIAVQLSILFQEKHTRLLDVNLRECGSIRNPQNITSVPFAEITA